MNFRDAAAGNPVLCAVEYIAVAGAARGCAHFGGGAACVGLGDADRGLIASQNERRAQAFLSFRAVGHDGGDAAHVGLDDNARCECAGFGNFLGHAADIEVACAHAAVGLWDRHAHKAGVTEVSDIVPAIRSRLIPFGGSL